MASISEKDRQRIIEILESGEELPLDYKHILFPPEKKEYELVYAGKEREEDILADIMAVPLQPIKTFRSSDNGWTNKLIFGDNLQVMKSLLDDPEIKGQVKLIYIDPPFATKQEFRGSQDQKAYQDKIAGAQFIEFLRKRLIFLRELLNEDGNIIFHLDSRKIHYAKLILDETFGEHNFINEIIWHKGREGGSSRSHSIGSSIPTEYQNLLVYAKNRRYRYWKQILGPYSKSTVSRIESDENGWYYTRGRMGRKPADWEIEAGVALKTYVSSDLSKTKEQIIKEITSPDAEYVAVGDVWDKSIIKFSTHTKYPTEKPESLLYLLIRAGTRKDELVLDALCGERNYQKEAIRNTLRYLLGGRYKNLIELAEENFNSNDKLKDLYGSFTEMKKHLQLPEKLSCSVDLATGTGKSYVIYGIARIMLAEGVVDYVLVVCPSTIEAGLMEKFKLLSGDEALRDLLSEDSVIRNPHIINATESITTGTICVENCHALYEHVKSSIRESLARKGDRTLIINDETHHVYNQTGKTFKKWKEFLLDEEFGFRYIVGLSGTCYIKDEYFTDVISRYSLREAMEEGFVKLIDYVAEDTSTTQDEKFQKIYDNHVENKNAKYRRVKPLTILITKDITACNRLTDDLIKFLSEAEGISEEDAAKKVLEVTSSPKHKENVRKLGEVDRSDSPIEWITSVSMLTEGWDVKNVFQIVPHEERAFDSKLLIAQVLGRGLRIPEAYLGQKPVVTVFNHDRWSSRIKHLVDEVLEIENRIYSYPVLKNPDYSFSIHNIDYAKLTETEEYKQEKEYEFTKGFITLIRQAPSLERETEYVRATTGESRRKKTLITYKMYSIEEIAEQLHNRFKSIDMETTETENPTNYADKYNIDWLKKLIRSSLDKIGEIGNHISDENRQRIYQAFGVLHRPAAKTVRYKMSPKALVEVKTSDRNRDSTGFASVRRGETTVFWDDNTKILSDEESLSFLSELEGDESLPRSAMDRIESVYNFKTPLNIVIADHRPERIFIRDLTKQENSKVIDSWIKSTDHDFYPIEYSWRKGEHPKRGRFNPDFFIKVNKSILMVEIKGDEEIREPSDENKAKYRAAKKHFEILNEQQSELRYFFNFLTPEDYDYFFDHLRNMNFNFISKLDAELEKNGNGKTVLDSNIN